MRMHSWNVNGIRAAWDKGFGPWLTSVDSDLVFVQETKAMRDQLKAHITDVPDWAGCEFHWGERKGYSGVAVYYRQQPDDLYVGLGIEEFDREGRVIGVRYGDLVVYGNYFPNGGKGPERVDYKLRFYDAMLARMKDLRSQGLTVVVCGDYNTAHHPYDLARPKGNKSTSGFLPEERAVLDRWHADGWRDSYRLARPDEREVYSWWSMQTRARDRNAGWRIDYFWVPTEAEGRVVDAGIDDQVIGSDHAPVYLELADA
jgi:exodeoxyribonuclease-3